MRWTRYAIMFLILLSFQAKAQIEQEIKSFIDSTEIIVNNGRKMMIQKLSVNNVQKSKEIYQYLSRITADKNSVAFDYTEDIYANLLFGDWHAVSAYMKDYKERTKRYTYPKDNQLTSLLYDRVSQASDSLLAESQQSDLDEESKRVIELILQLTKNRAVDEKYNQLLKEYHNKYKRSSYEDFIKKYMPAVTSRASIAWSLGSGIILPGGSLADNFSPNASVNLSMDININKVFTSLYLNGAGLKLKVPFSAGSVADHTDYEKAELFHYLDAGLKVGYFSIRSERFHFAPYASICGTVLESQRFDDTADDDKEFQVINSFSCGPGIHTEMKLKEYNRTNYFGNPNNTYISIKLEAGYNFITKFDDKYFKGNVSMISIALVWGAGKF